MMMCRNLKETKSLYTKLSTIISKWPKDSIYQFDNWTARSGNAKGGIETVSPSFKQYLTSKVLPSYEETLCVNSAVNTKCEQNVDHAKDQSATHVSLKNVELENDRIASLTNAQQQSVLDALVRLSGNAYRAEYPPQPREGVFGQTRDDYGEELRPNEETNA